MIELTLELAQSAAHAALAKARSLGKPFSVSVVDEAGRLMYFLRDTGAGFLTFDTSRAKATAAASFRRATSDIAAGRDANPLLWYSLPAVSGGQALPSPGGMPLLREGRVIGAIGVGGGLPDEDDQVATAGAEAIRS